MTTQFEAFQQARAAAQNRNQSVSTLRQLYAEGKVPERDREFVTSLLRANDNRGLSLKQEAWVDKLVARFTAPPAPKQEALQVGSMAGVVQLLERARSNGLKFPKLWLRIGPDNQDLRITIAGEKSKTPGHVVLTDGEKFGQNKFFGKISPDGNLALGRDGQDYRTALIDVLTRLSTDPVKVAAEFGHLTGHCCFCSLTLTDERSTHVGYGRRCAEKFGLPWGEAS